MGRLILNCDLGENEPPGQTREIMRFVDAANIGCGAHAGSEAKTLTTIELARDAGVMIGAHPGLPERGGRAAVSVDASGFRILLERQVGKFQSLAMQLECRMDYVKLHGSLYHAVERDLALADTYIEFIQDLGDVSVFALANGVVSRNARAASLRVYDEAFADRGYASATALQPRESEGALIADTEVIGERVRRLIREGRIESVTGESVGIDAQTLCVHSDSPKSLEVLKLLRALIDREGEGSR